MITCSAGLFSNCYRRNCVPEEPDVHQGAGNAHENARWSQVSLGDGIATYRLSAWAHFFDFLEEEVFQSALTNKQVYIWRGQRRSDWSLSSSLDRFFEKIGIIQKAPDVLETRSTEHLRSFKYAARGRRGPNPQTLEGENDWWALGQHYGLATPLLDWTRSPFAAAYFAFEENPTDQTATRVVYGLDQWAVMKRNVDIADLPSLEQGRVPIIEFIEPMSDENQRLVNQGGLFTRAPIGTPIEQWVAHAFEGISSPILMRIEIPNDDRLICLRTLDRMNINHLSLFPDLVGASRSVNLKSELGG
ncbi:MAG: FRG domain-containing protein [Terriglobia bacterium]|nr:FRG domain-containing protein [Terriglobia bacterium]